MVLYLHGRAMLFVLLMLCSIRCWVQSLRTQQQLQQCLDIKHHSTRTTLDECYLVPDYTVAYYYRDLKEKFVEVMSVNNCSLISTSGEILGFEPLQGHDADLHVRVVPPSLAVTQRWGTFGHEFYNVSRVTYRTNEILCKSKLFGQFKQGGYKDAKGCGQMMQYDRMGKPFKIIKRRGATLHPEHIRCHSKRSSDTCMEASQRSMVLDDDLRSLHNYPFLLTAKQAIVSRGGQLRLPCGFVSLFASCEAWGWGMMNVTASIPREAPQLCRDYDNGKSVRGENNCPFPIHDRVFIVTSYDDTQIGQFIQEALPKLVYHLDFILANKDIKLHYGFSKLLDQLPTFVLPHMIFEWLGVADRLINGTVYAKTVYLPREGGCQDVGYNAWELLQVGILLFFNLINTPSLLSFTIFPQFFHNTLYELDKFVAFPVDPRIVPKQSRIQSRRSQLATIHCRYSTIRKSLHQKPR